MGPEKTGCPVSWAIKLESLGAKVGGDGCLRPLGGIPGVAEDDSPRGDVPALVMVRIDLLEFQVVDVEGGDLGRSRLVAIHLVGESDGGDVVACQVGDFPDDVVPLAVLELKVVGVAAQPGPRLSTRATREMESNPGRSG